MTEAICRGDIDEVILMIVITDVIRRGNIEEVMSKIFIV